jgi:hypothetical protein
MENLQEEADSTNQKEDEHKNPTKGTCQQVQLHLYFVFYHSSHHGLYVMW